MPRQTVCKTLPNRNLTPTELKWANALLEEIRERIARHAADDPALVFAYRRKIAKELGYDERGKPMQRKKLKMLKRDEQGGYCVGGCGQELPPRYAVLDRKDAIKGYTPENTELICENCDRKRQAAKQFK